MSSTKQAKSQGNSGNEPKLHQVTDWREKPWEKPGSVRGQFSSGQWQCMIMIQAALQVRRSQIRSEHSKY